MVIQKINTKLAKNAINLVKRNLKPSAISSPIGNVIEFPCRSLQGDTFQQGSAILTKIKNRSAISVPFKEKGVFDLREYAKIFEELKDDMDIALSSIADNKSRILLAEKIKSSGGLFTVEELCNMEELYLLRRYELDDIIKCRGNLSKLGIYQGNVKLKSREEIKHIIEEYVNKLAVFKEKDIDSGYEYTKLINRFIDSQEKYLAQDILYRGEESKSQILTLLSLIAKKTENPAQIVKYFPDHLYSTTKSLESLTDIYHYADECFIRIIDVKNRCKGLDINNLLQSKNKFFNQQEILLPSTTEFEVIEGFFESGRLFVTLKPI